MTVGEIMEELSKYPSDLEVFTKKTDIMGNVGFVYSVRQDVCSAYGATFPCVVVTDEIAESLK